MTQFAIAHPILTFVMVVLALLVVDNAVISIVKGVTAAKCAKYGQAVEIGGNTHKGKDGGADEEK